MLAGSRLQPRGVALLLLGVALCAAAWFLREAVLLWPGVFLVLLPVAAWAGLFASDPSLAVTRGATPDEVPAGDALRVDLRLTQRRAVPPGTLTVTDPLPESFGGPRSFLLTPPGRGRTASVSYDCRPGRRGRYSIDTLAYHYGDPLGLATRRARRPVATEVLVTPRVWPLSEAEPAASARTGETPIPHLAFSGPDDVLVREYRHHDEVRRIHWKSTARTGTLMVRREEQAWDPVAWVLLDSRAAATGRGDAAAERFEWLVSLAASVGVALLDAGYEVGLIQPGVDTYMSQARAHSEPSRAWLRHLVDATRTERRTLTGALRPAEQAAAGHLVIAILGRLRLDDARELAQLRDGQHRCWVLYLPVDPADEEAVREQRAASDLLGENDWELAATPAGVDPGEAWASLARVRRRWAG